jgi:hypothetical protein
MREKLEELAWLHARRFDDDMALSAWREATIGDAFPAILEYVRGLKAERDERVTMAARAQEALRYVMNGLPATDAVWAAYGNADSTRAWLAARDAQQRREGAVMKLLDMSIGGLAWDETSLRREAEGMLIDAGERERYEQLLAEAQRLRESA